MAAVKALTDGDLGAPKFFNSSFAEPVEEGNIRLKKALGGGPLEDIGVYCINASRYFFREEPREVLIGVDQFARDVAHGKAVNLVGHRADYRGAGQAEVVPRRNGRPTSCRNSSSSRYDWVIEAS